MKYGRKLISLRVSERLVDLIERVGRDEMDKIAACKGTELSKLFEMSHDRRDGESALLGNILE